MKYEWKNLFVLGANFFSSNIKLSLGFYNQSLQL